MQAVHPKEPRHLNSPMASWVVAVSVAAEFNVVAIAAQAGHIVHSAVLRKATD